MWGSKKYYDQPLLNVWIDAFKNERKNSYFPNSLDEQLKLLLTNLKKSEKLYSSSEIYSKDGASDPAAHLAALFDLNSPISDDQFAFFKYFSDNIKVMIKLPELSQIMHFLTRGIIRIFYQFDKEIKSPDLNHPIFTERYRPLFRVSILVSFLGDDLQMILNNFFINFPTCQNNFKNQLFRKFDSMIFTDVCDLITSISLYQVILQYVVILMKNFSQKNELSDEELNNIKLFFQIFNNKYFRTFFCISPQIDQFVVIDEFVDLLKCLLINDPDFSVLSKKFITKTTDNTETNNKAEINNNAETNNDTETNSSTETYNKAEINNNTEANNNTETNKYTETFNNHSMAEDLNNNENINDSDFYEEETVLIKKLDVISSIFDSITVVLSQSESNLNHFFQIKPARSLIYYIIWVLNQTNFTETNEVEITENNSYKFQNVENKSALDLNPIFKEKFHPISWDLIQIDENGKDSKKDFSDYRYLIWQNALDCIKKLLFSLRDDSLIIGLIFKSEKIIFKFKYLFKIQSDKISIKKKLNDIDALTIYLIYFLCETIQNYPCINEHTEIIDHFANINFLFNDFLFKKFFCKEKQIIFKNFIHVRNSIYKALQYISSTSNVICSQILGVISTHFINSPFIICDELINFLLVLNKNSNNLFLESFEANQYIHSCISYGTLLHGNSLEMKKFYLFLEFVLSEKKWCNSFFENQAFSEFYYSKLFDDEINEFLFEILKNCLPKLSTEGSMKCVINEIVFASLNQLISRKMDSINTNEIKKETIYRIIKLFRTNFYENIHMVSVSLNNGIVTKIMKCIKNIGSEKQLIKLMKLVHSLSNESINYKFFNDFFQIDFSVYSKVGPHPQMINVLNSFVFRKSKYNSFDINESILIENVESLNMAHLILKNKEAHFDFFNFISQIVGDIFQNQYILMDSLFYKYILRYICEHEFDMESKVFLKIISHIHMWNFPLLTSSNFIINDFNLFKIIKSSVTKSSMNFPSSFSILNKNKNGIVVGPLNIFQFSFAASISFRMNKINFSNSKCSIVNRNDNKELNINLSDNRINENNQSINNDVNFIDYKENDLRYNNNCINYCDDVNLINSDKSDFELLSEKNQKFSIKVINGRIAVYENNILKSISKFNIATEKEWHRIFVSVVNNRIFIALDGECVCFNNSNADHSFLVLSNSFLSSKLILVFCSYFEGLIGDIQLLKPQNYSDSEIVRLSKYYKSYKTFDHSVLCIKPSKKAQNDLNDQPFMVDTRNPQFVFYFDGFSLTNKTNIFRRIKDINLLLILLSTNLIDKEKEPTNNSLFFKKSQQLLKKIMKIIIRFLDISPKNFPKLFFNDEQMDLFISFLNKNLFLANEKIFNLLFNLLPKIPDIEKRKKFFGDFLFNFNLSFWKKESFLLYRKLIFEAIPNLMHTENRLFEAFSLRSLFLLINISKDTFSSKSYLCNKQIYHFIYLYLERVAIINKNIKENPEIQNKAKENNANQVWKVTTSDSDLFNNKNYIKQITSCDNDCIAEFLKFGKERAVFSFLCDMLCIKPNNLMTKTSFDLIINHFLTKTNQKLITCKLLEISKILIQKNEKIIDENMFCQLSSSYLCSYTHSFYDSNNYSLISSLISVYISSIFLFSFNQVNNKKSVLNTFDIILVQFSTGKTKLIEEIIFSCWIIYLYLKLDEEILLFFDRLVFCKNLRLKNMFFLTYLVFGFMENNPNFLLIDKVIDTFIKRTNIKSKDIVSMINVFYIILLISDNENINSNENKSSKENSNSDDNHFSIVEILFLLNNFDTQFIEEKKKNLLSKKIENNSLLSRFLESLINKINSLNKLVYCEEIMFFICDISMIGRELSRDYIDFDQILKKVEFKKNKQEYMFVSRLFKEYGIHSDYFLEAFHVFSGNSVISTEEINPQSNVFNKIIELIRIVKKKLSKYVNLMKGISQYQTEDYDYYQNDSHILSKIEKNQLILEQARRRMKQSNLYANFKNNTEKYFIFDQNYFPIFETPVNPMEIILVKKDQQQKNLTVFIRFQKIQSFECNFYFTNQFFLFGGKVVYIEDVNFIVKHSDLSFEFFLSDGLMFIIEFSQNHQKLATSFFDIFAPKVLTLEYIEKNKMNFKILNIILLFNFVSGNSFNIANKNPHFNGEKITPLFSLSGNDVSIECNKFFSSFNFDYISYLKEISPLNQVPSSNVPDSILPSNPQLAGIARRIGVLSDSITFLHCFDQKVFCVDVNKKFIGASIILPPRVPQPTIQIFNSNSLSVDSTIFSIPLSMLDSPICCMLESGYLAVAFKDIFNIFIYKIKHSKLIFLKKIKIGENVKSFVKSPPNLFVVFFENSKRIHIIKINSGDSIYCQYFTPNESNVQNIASYQNILVSVDFGNEVAVSLLNTLLTVNYFRFEETNEVVSSIQISEDAEIVVLFGDNKIVVYDLLGKKLRELYLKDNIIKQMILTKRVLRINGLVMNEKESVLSLVLDNDGKIECRDLKKFDVIFSTCVKENLDIIAFDENNNYFGYTFCQRNINGIFFS